MSDFDIAQSLIEAKKRFSVRSARLQRSDAGRARISPNVRCVLESLLAGQKRPPMRELLAQIGALCRASGERCPSRAAVYKYLPNAAGPTYVVRELPTHVRASLYNIDDGAEVSGRQLAFYLFNHGDARSLSFAAGMPWLCLYQAERLRGFRPKSHALLRAIMRARGV
jgi:hypothetical protein